MGQILFLLFVMPNLCRCRCRPNQEAEAAGPRRRRRSAAVDGRAAGLAAEPAQQSPPGAAGVTAQRDCGVCQTDGTAAGRDTAEGGAGSEGDAAGRADLGGERALHGQGVWVAGDGVVPALVGY